MEIQEIADILGVERNRQLYNSGHNSTIAQLINRFLKKQGFKTKRIDFDEGDYSISVCAPDIYSDNADIKPENTDYGVDISCKVWNSIQIIISKI